MKTRLLSLFFCLFFAAGCSSIANKLNRLVHDTLEQTGTDIMGVPVQVDTVAISLKNGAGELNGFTIANPEGFTDPYAFSMQQIRMNIDLRSLGGTPKRLEDFTLDAPVITIEVLDDDRVNLEEIARNIQQALEQKQQEDTSSSAETTPSEEQNPAETRFAISNIHVTGAKLTVRHRKLEGGVKELVLPDIHLKDVGGATGVTGAEISMEILKAVTRQGMTYAMKQEAQKGAAKFFESLKKNQDHSDPAEEKGSEGGASSLLDRFK